MSQRPGEAVGPLIRGLAVLRALSLAGGRRSVSGLARDTRLARSTVDRVLSTLGSLGHTRLDGRDAVLAPRLMELGNAYLAASGLPDRLGPPADRLADRLDESVSLAVPDGDGSRFVHQAPRRRTMSVSFRVGDLLPAECSAAGAVFAAAWPDQAWEHWRRCRAADPGLAAFPVLPAAPGGRGAAARSFPERVDAARRTGWAVDDQLIEPGLVAVAIAVRDAGGAPACALSAVSHTSRHSAASLQEAVLAPLRETAARMERILREQPRSPGADGDRTASFDAALKQELGPHFVESLARGLAVVTALGRGPGTLADLARATGLPRATVRRSLITLEHLGYARAGGRSFSLAPRVLELGFSPLSRLTLPAIAQPHLARLVERVHDSASMAVLADDDIRYIARVPTVRIMSVDITVGARFPAYATSMGRVLLAGLPEDERAGALDRVPLRRFTRRTVTSAARLGRLLKAVERDGYALADEELEEGLRSIAVPVRGRDGAVAAAVNVSTHAGRRSAAQALEEVLPPLRETAARIEADLRTASRYTRIAVT